VTTPARQKEADEASVAFHIALTQIGVGTVEEALKLWNAVPATSRAATAGGWLRRAIRLVMTRRSRARELARAYYRLARALRTGRTVANPYEPEPSYVTLAELRRQFSELAGGDAEVPQEGADERIPVDQLPGLREQEALTDRQAEEELGIVLDALGPKNLGGKLEDIDPDAPASDVDRLRDDAHAQAGARQAAAAERVAMNGGRSAIWNHAQRDQRALGYVRVSRTGTPCGWCAMLISRGPTYRSERSATYSDGDKYHDNCHCYAMPVFTREQYSSSDLFDLNRRYSELWPQVTKGLSGKAAVSAWRRFIRQEQKAAAQEARRSTTTNAQEAQQ
jgi:hypothetical protein